MQDNKVSKNSPLKVFEFCPKCGAKSLKTFDNKAIKCSECNFSFYINMAAAVAAVIKNDCGEILFTIRKNNPSKGMLDLPGGFVDLGETAENAIDREVMEELDVQLVDRKIIGTFTNKYLFNNIEYQTLDVIFEAKALNLNNIKCDDDVESYSFIKLDDVNEDQIAFTSIKNVVMYLKSINNTLNNYNIYQNTENILDKSLPETFFIQSDDLQYNTLLPGEILFNFPSDYFPVKAIVKTDSPIFDFCIEDSEQTVVFEEKEIQKGEVILNQKVKDFEELMPTLNVSYRSENKSFVKILIEFKRK